MQKNKIEVSKEGLGKTIYIPLSVFKSGIAMTPFLVPIQMIPLSRDIGRSVAKVSMRICETYSNKWSGLEIHAKRNGGGGTCSCFSLEF